MSNEYNIRDTKNMFELLVNKRVTITLKDQKETQITGVLVHQTQFELLLKANVKSKETGETLEKLRIIPKHSVLIVKEK
ncbi:hypothetical protein HMPREF2586_00065 [Staphylococcus sp. HMSC034G07]|uniref:hypothetical protein n=1 Tax=Staphylococcus sp. HMSC034G07 TaxID=1715065 RepID=UPI0008A8FB4A|nr:hypothetical protein [Staphylococcus sp. HMSC034G07]OHO42552.1 hypothetical protein HMPREF2586_00065 [Staphylococcus sp. HMSC034G07]